MTADIAVVALSAAEARNLTDEIRNALSVGYDGLVRAWQGRADQALGYDSWDAYCSTEFTEGRMVRLDREQRREIVAQMRSAGMSTRAIGPALGVHHDTVADDVRAVGNPTPAPVTGIDGKTYSPKAKVTETTKTEYDVNTTTGEISEPNPIAAAITEVRNGPAYIAGNALSSVYVSARAITEKAGGPAAVVRDLDDSEIDRQLAVGWVQMLDQIIPTLTDLRTRLARKNLRSVQ